MKAPLVGADRPEKIWSKIPFQGYDEKSDCGGDCYGQGEYKIFLGDDGVFDKPVIIIDGFDPGDKRKIDENKSDENNNKGIYLGSLTLSDNKDRNLGDDLRRQGYDLVILNFPLYYVRGRQRDGGTDYIERNAMILVELIQKVNLMKRGEEEIIIVGPSMGGLISRYALAYMEKNNMPHNTHLWISLDAPHQGANIPIGDQYFISYFAEIANNAAAEEALRTKLNPPAAKQMLINHYNTEAKRFRSRFMNALNQMGYPKKLRKVSVINGSVAGKSSGKPGDLAINMRVFNEILIDLFFWKWRFKTLQVSGGKAYFTNDNPNASSIVFRGFKVFNDRSYFFRGPAYDTSPGGLFDTQRQIKEMTPAIFHWLGFIRLKNEFATLIPMHSFIPTFSALDLKNGASRLTENLSDKNLICAGDTPFDNYYAPINNEGHVNLNASNVSFIFDEINRKPQAPTSRLSFIQGQGLICDGSVQTFSLRSCEKGQGVTLEASPNLKVIARGPGSLTVQASDQNGKGWIKALDRNGYPIEQKNIWVGKPRFELRSDLYDYLLTVYMADKSSRIKKEDQYITSVDWRPRFGHYDENTNNFHFSVSGTIGGSYEITVTATNTCGTLAQTENMDIPPSSRDYTCWILGPHGYVMSYCEDMYDRTYDPSYRRRYYSLRKNAPLLENSPTQESALIQSYIVYDLLGLEVKRQLSPSSEIDLSGLPSGQYVVKYQIDGKWRSENRFVDDKGR